jgi:quinol monooxygenase YgiN
MYGTVARLRIKPEMVGAVKALAEGRPSRAVPGSVASYLYQMDADPQELYLAVVFTSKETYLANANSPEQNAEYEQLLSFLEAPPEWHDGTILAASEPD